MTLMSSLSRARCLLAAIAGLLAASALSAPLFSVRNGSTTVSFESPAFDALAHQSVTAYDFHEKQDHVYTGVPVRELLSRAGVDFGEKLRGRELRQVVVVHCRDHYDIVFALAEFDDAFNGRTILLVDRQDGHAVPAGQGPLRLVVPGDKRPARWARMVESLEVVAVAEGPPPSSP